MAIVIPSKNIYSKQNPKIIDNVIERIEVGAIKVEPNNEYDTVVYNKTVENYNRSIKQTDNIVEKVFSSGEAWGGSGKMLTVAYAYAGYIEQKTWENTIYIPVAQYDKYIKNIFSGTRKTEEPYINCSIYGRVGKYDIKSSTPWYILNENNITAGKFNSTLTNEDENTITVFEFPLSVEDTPKGFNLTAKADIKDYNNLTTAKFEKEIINGVEYYVITLEVLAELSTISFSGSSTQMFKTSEDYTAIPVDMEGKYEMYIPTRIEYSFIGDTIGIDLVDKTVHINGETAKKVHSVDGNELMQTSNYYISQDTNSIENSFTKTQTLYSMGKETATIRCSISDYYEENGEKAIAIDNSNARMSFKIGDTVIPMVHGADKKDRPMSVYVDGMPKKFEVLGTKIYYDGAVWQELSLQEVPSTLDEDIPMLFVDTATGELKVLYLSDEPIVDFTFDGTNLYATSNDEFANNVELVDGKVYFNKN